MNTIAASNQSIPASAFSNPALPPSSNVPSSASFSLPPSSSVGCRLASLAESPVHRYTINTPKFVNNRNLSGSNHKQTLYHLGLSLLPYWTRMMSLETLPPPPPPSPLLPSHHHLGCIKYHLLELHCNQNLPSCLLPVQEFQHLDPPNFRRCLLPCYHHLHPFFHWHPHLYHLCSQHLPCYHPHH